MSDARPSLIVMRAEHGPARVPSDLVLCDRRGAPSWRSRRGSSWHGTYACVECAVAEHAPGDTIGLAPWVGADLAAVSEPGEHEQQPDDRADTGDALLDGVAGRRDHDAGEDERQRDERDLD